ncbi:uncharacterized protein UTRI_10362 [Ustilago trichophora]|uniref:RING-type E3 ubiquitin transferase n=1 Tax=Ustilago trichophora TaxID=86804 RepID=A0A5C3EB51_9BASI|nr:uncharacterized protein UTRI_10362 [Ustilago trichophora]
MRTPHTSTKNHVIPALTETPACSGVFLDNDDDEGLLSDSNGHSDKGKGKTRAMDLHLRSPSTAASASYRAFSPDSDITTSAATAAAAINEKEEQEDNNNDNDHCLICHSFPLNDQTVLPNCLHSQFCFGCIVRWVQIRRCCPLCLASVGEYVIHAVRGDADYLRFHLPPAPLDFVSSTASTSHIGAGATDGDTVNRAALVSRVQRARVQRQRNTSSHPTEALEFRKRIYQHTLYAAHVGSNRHTLYRTCPNPIQIRQSGEIQRRIALFLRRELSIWPEVDGEFLTQYICSLLQVFRVSDEETVRLVSEFLGARVGRHLLHELECWLRSGKQQLRFYDESPLLQYPPPSESRRRTSRDQVEQVGESSRTPQETATAADRRTEVAHRRKRLLVKLESEKRRVQ